MYSLSCANFYTHNSHRSSYGNSKTRILLSARLPFKEHSLQDCHSSKLALYSSILLSFSAARQLVLTMMETPPAVRVCSRLWSIPTRQREIKYSLLKSCCQPHNLYGQCHLHPYFIDKQTEAQLQTPVGLILKAPPRVICAVSATLRSLSLFSRN